jgi:hypothetical protein
MTSKDEVTVKRVITFSSDTKGSDPQHIPSEAMDTQAKRGSSVINCKPVPEKAPKLAKALSIPLLESFPPYKEPGRWQRWKAKTPQEKYDRSKCLYHIHGLLEPRILPALATEPGIPKRRKTLVLGKRAANRVWSHAVETFTNGWDKGDDDYR